MLLLCVFFYEIHVSEIEVTNLGTYLLTLLFQSQAIVEFSFRTIDNKLLKL